MRSDADFVFLDSDDVLTAETVEMDLDAVDADVARVHLVVSVDRGSLADTRDLSDVE